MRKNEYLNYSDEEQVIIEMMFGSYDTEEERQEAIGDMMNSLG